MAPLTGREGRGSCHCGVSSRQLVWGRSLLYRLSAACPRYPVDRPRRVLSLRIASSAPAPRPQLPQSPASLCRWPPFLLKQRRRLGCANSALSGFLRLSLRLFGVLVSSLSLSLVGGEQCSRASCLRRYMLVRGSLLEISSAALLLCRHVAVRSHRLYGVSRVCLRFLLRVSIQPSPLQVAESKIA